MYQNAAAVIKWKEKVVQKKFFVVDEKRKVSKFSRERVVEEKKAKKQCEIRFWKFPPLDDREILCYFQLH